jgi:hypothetical protein
MSEEMSMNDLMKNIREATKNQRAASRVDEIKVMRTMLNDPDFKVSIYDRNKGLIGTRCPREESVKFIAGIVSSLTGLEDKAVDELTNKYEFTKKDAIYMLDTQRDFNQTYLSTGRKLPIIQSANSEAAIFYRPVASKEKVVPHTATGPKMTVVPAFNKVICKSKSPKYNTN